MNLEAGDRNFLRWDDIEFINGEPKMIRAILLLFWTALAIGPAMPKDPSPAISITTSATRVLAESEWTFDQQQASARPSRYSRKRAKKEAVVQTLTGTVEWEYKPLSWDCDVPNCDHFALYDDATQTNFELDDARAALPFEGKRAKVTGVVDAKNSTIHVLSVEAAK